jgi:hypothetical protein
MPASKLSPLHAHILLYIFSTGLFTPSLRIRMRSTIDFTAIPCIESSAYENMATSLHASNPRDGILCTWRQPPDRAGHGVTALFESGNNRRWDHLRR